MKKILAASALLVIVLAVSYGTRYFEDRHKAGIKVLEDRTEQVMRAHISEISPEKEVLGGKFYVVSISKRVSDDGSTISGEVEYEDGHNSYIANYVFRVNPNGSLSLRSFKPLYK